MEPMLKNNEGDLVDNDVIINELKAAVESKNKQLEKYEHIYSRYKKAKKKASNYNRDRIILLVFAIILIGVVCYQGIQQNKAAIEQEKLQQLYKTKNGEGPREGIYIDLDN